MFYVVGSDDIDFVKNEFFSNVTSNIAYLGNYCWHQNYNSLKLDVFISGNSPCLDMAILINCDHHIISLGSFGFWTGYLGDGEVLYPQTDTSRPYRFSKPFYESANLTRFHQIKFT